MFIANPNLGKLESLRLWWWARHDAPTITRANFEDGYFTNPRTRSMAQKASAACEIQCTKQGARKWKDLRALNFEYLSTIKKLEATLQAGREAVGAAESVRYEGDDSLSPSALKERCAARSIKPRRHYAAQEAELRRKLDELAQEASKEYDLPGYELARITAIAGCRCAEKLHYALPAERYIQFLLRRVDLQGIDATAQPIEFTWPERIEQTFPEMDFTQHESLYQAIDSKG